MNTKIEPGCIAVVVKHPVEENNGKVVTVGECLGEITCDENDYKWIGTRWEVDREIRAHCLREDGPSKVYARHINEECLMRIDGYEGSIVCETASLHTVVS